MTVLDTNVISELMRPRPAAPVLRWIEGQIASSLYITAITQAEILYGLELLRPGRRREGLIAAAETLFLEDFENHILSFNTEAAGAYARIASIRRAAGTPISQFDAQIAAIAKVNGASLATRNVTDFKDCQISLVNPWLANG